MAQKYKILSTTTALDTEQGKVVQVPDLKASESTLGKKGRGFVGAEKDAKLKCQKCTKLMKLKEYYKYKDGTYPDYCKKCMTMHVDAFDESTFLPILEDYDVPYVKPEWVSLRNKIYYQYAQLNRPMPSSVVMGKYLAKMRLKNWLSYGWKDSQQLSEIMEGKEEADEKIKQERKKKIENARSAIQAEYDMNLISEYEYQTKMSSIRMRFAEIEGDYDFNPMHDMPIQYNLGRPEYENGMMPRLEAFPCPLPVKMPDYIKDELERNKKKEEANARLIGGPQYAEGGAGTPSPTGVNVSLLPNYANQLTQEDKIYLAVKWGQQYKPEEWIALEKKYTEMCNSFEIQDADTIATLKLLCKTELKANQAIDLGDIEAFQKLSKVLNDLRKSAKFTAAQSKDGEKGELDCIGNLVRLCEKEGFIPRYPLDIPQDKVDQTLKDTNDYLYNLVTKDLGFGQQIEDALFRIKQQKEANANSLFDDQVDEDDSIDIVERLDYLQAQERAKEEDENLLAEEDEISDEEFDNILNQIK